MTIFFVTSKLALCYYFKLHIYIYKVNSKEGIKNYIYIYTIYIYSMYSTWLWKCLEDVHIFFIYPDTTSLKSKTHFSLIFTMYDQFP